MKLLGILVLAGSFMGLSAACSTTVEDSEPAAEQASQERRVIGKADHVWGSCQTPDHSGDYCDAKSDLGNCYCDDLCTSYGDCCSDYQEQCVAEEPAECATDDDCYLHSNYCNACSCEAYPNDLQLAQCPEELIVNCFVDPCGDQAVACEQGECVTRRIGAAN